MSGKEEKNSDWQFNDHKFLTQKCIDDSGEVGTKHPKLISSYCWCSTNEIQSNFTKKEYLKISNEQIEIQLEEILPVIQKCQAALKEKIEMKEVRDPISQNTQKLNTQFQ